MLLLQVALTLGVFFGLGSYLKEQSQTEPLDLQLAFIGANAALLGLGLAAAFYHANRDLKGTSAAIATAISDHAEIRLLRDDDFHKQFSIQADTATSYVRIMNMSPDGRYFESAKDRRDYFRRMLRLIRKNTQTQYRRLERWTDQSEPWIKTLLEKLNGRSNASLAILSDSPAEKMGLALSVQLIDGEFCWMVAVEDHERLGRYRDVMVRDPQFADIMEKYYDRLWKKAVVVLENGVLTDKGKQLINGRLHA